MKYVSSQIKLNIVSLRCGGPGISFRLLSFVDFHYLERTHHSGNWTCFCPQMKRSNLSHWTTHVNYIFISIYDWGLLTGNNENIHSKNCVNTCEDLKRDKKVENKLVKPNSEPLVQEKLKSTFSTVPAYRQFS